MEASYVVLFITTDSAEEASKIARVLVERKKAACVNIVPRVDSLFWWEGAVDSARENLLIVKTRASLVPEAVKLVREVHSYDVPEVIALPIVGGNQDYLDWIEQNTG